MERERTTIKQACEKWVDTFNAFPQSLLEKAYTRDGYLDEREINEITPSMARCQECGEEFFDKEKYSEHIRKHAEEIVKNHTNFEWGIDFKEEDNTYTIYGDDDDSLEEGFITEEKAQERLNELIEEWIDGEVENFYSFDDSADQNREYGLPMWGTLWQTEWIDRDWIKAVLEDIGNAKKFFFNKPSQAKASLTKLLKIMDDYKSDNFELVEFN